MENKISIVETAIAIKMYDILIKEAIKTGKDFIRVMDLVDKLRESRKILINQINTLEQNATQEATKYYRICDN